MSERGGHEGVRPTGGLLARNAYINLVGQALPIVVAILAIPFLVKLLGSERFGVLALAWVVMGYFGFFDFGLGRATTKFVSEHYARNDTESLPELIWSSVAVNFCLGLLGGCILALITPWLTQSALNVPDALIPETRTSFYLLAVSVPLIVATAALRGVLEAIQRFDLVNLVKIPASIFNYLGPLVVLYFFRGLVAVILLLVVSRAVVLLAHLVLCIKALPILSRGFRLDLRRMKPLVGLGGWLTVSSFVGPSIVSIDRFMIGSFVSLSAVTLYTTPYEAVTKLTIFSASLLSVLFPAFSAMSVSRAHELRRLYFRALKYLLVVVAPIVGVILALAYELLGLWVTPGFARDSEAVSRWLAIGVLLNVLATVPLTLVQGIGRADISAKLQILQVPLYALAIWYLAEDWGIAGVAAAWALRAGLELAVLALVAGRLLPATREGSKDHFPWASSTVVWGFLLLFLCAGTLLSDEATKVVAVAVLLGFLVLWEWLFFLKPAERATFMAGAKPLSRLLKR